jgi:hypothetical protein
MGKSLYPQGVLASLLAVVLMGGCTSRSAGGEAEGASSGAPPGGEGSFSTGGPNEACYASRWAGPDQPRTGSRCAANGLSAADGYTCRCDEEPLPSNYNSGPASNACADALVEACGVDPRDPGFCEYPATGTCFRGTDPETWSCGCTGSETFAEASGSECLEALTGACAQRCEGVLGSCHDDVERAEGYVCACEWQTPADQDVQGSEDAALRPATGELVGTVEQPFSAPTCGAAVQEACHERCRDPSGTCTLNQDRRFDCDCGDGTAHQVDYDPARGAQACDGALRAVCGSVQYAPRDRCESTRDGLTGLCEALPKVTPPLTTAESGFDYACQCGAGEQVVIPAVGCAHALLAHCPEAIGPEQHRAAPPGGHGALCSEGDDCNGGVCFASAAPDPICSSRCADDGDCPNDALCAFIGEASLSSDRGGHCFKTCEALGNQGTSCSLLNEASQNPLLCADRVDVSLKELGEDESGTVCVPLTVYYHR